MKSTKNNPLNYYELVPLAVMLVGFIMRWLAFDQQAIVIHIGFLLCGIGSLILISRDKSEEPLTPRALKIISGAIIILLVIVHFIFNVAVFPFALAALGIQYVVGQRNKTKITNPER